MVFNRMPGAGERRVLTGSKMLSYTVHPQSRGPIVVSRHLSSGQEKEGGRSLSLYHRPAPLSPRGPLDSGRGLTGGDVKRLACDGGQHDLWGELLHIPLAEL
ncbi:hypothetical protein EVAR_21595_1 [Eumeta japonica]|uniref:Uncharacterized protein n=1 Tax=Eumeta variegata TaxID=151549 RepID=A0A4C1UYR7_EUMVA|nr:hypothetical protein EVAR_21595_1 [Eumeta japonica]